MSRHPPYALVRLDAKPIRLHCLCNCLDSDEITYCINLDIYEYSFINEHVLRSATGVSPHRSTLLSYIERVGLCGENRCARDEKSRLQAANAYKNGR